jgi:hypothetical protein
MLDAALKANLRAVYGPVDSGLIGFDVVVDGNAVALLGLDDETVVGAVIDAAPLGGLTPASS